MEVIWSGTLYRQAEQAYALTSALLFARITMTSDAPGNGLPTQAEMKRYVEPAVAVTEFGRVARGRPKGAGTAPWKLKVKPVPHTHCPCGFALTPNMQRHGLKHCPACRKGRA